jgi:hypothetical protein
VGRSLTRGRVCRLQLLLTLASAVIRVRVPWDSRPYFTVSDSRLLFFPPHTTHRTAVEVFDPSSTRDSSSPLSLVLRSVPSYNTSARTTQKTPSSLIRNACLLARYLTMDICEPHRKLLLRHWFYCCVRVFRTLLRNGSTCHNIFVSHYYEFA